MEEETNSINLLDLPSLPLEEVFSYCNLIKLTECNKFMKHMVETNSLLRRRLYLRIQIPFGTLKKEDKEILKACLESTRTYERLEIDHRSDRYVFAEKDPELNVKTLVDKHAATIKEVEIMVTLYGVHSVIEVLQYLENLINVNDIWMIFEGKIHDRREEHISEYFIEVADVSFPNNSFSQLKFLRLSLNTSIVFSTFKNCTALESLSVFCERDMTLYFSDFYLILKNSRENLQKLNIGIDKIKKKEIEVFLRELKDCELNLKTFKFKVPSLKDINNTHLLMEFLKSQKNLEEFEFNSRVGLIFVNSFRASMTDFPKLTKLQFSLSATSAVLFEDLEPWNLHQLQELEFNVNANEMFFKVLNASSQSLKKLLINGLNFLSIPQNYQNLVTLSVGPNCFQSSNDIFLIFKHLKKLEELKFVFPQDSPLDLELFESKEDLKLPEIKEVNFWLNQSITEEIFQKLLNPVNNVTEFLFDFKDDSNFIEMNYIEISIRMLPNLTSLITSSDISAFLYSELEQIESNVKQFLRAPHLFAINCESIEFSKKWILKLQENGLVYYSPG